MCDHTARVWRMEEAEEMLLLLEVEVVVVVVGKQSCLVRTRQLESVLLSGLLETILVVEGYDEAEEDEAEEVAVMYTR